MTAVGVRREGGAFQWVQAPPGDSLPPEATGAGMEETKCLKPSDSGSRIGDRASVQAATRVNAEQTSHDEGLVKGVVSRGHRNFSSCFGIQGPSPFARRGLFPSTVNLTCGRRS